MRRLLRALLFAIPAYIITAVAGALLVAALSSNRHDRSLEAAMTGAFVIGPLGAILAFIAGFTWRRARRTDTETP